MFRPISFLGYRAIRFVEELGAMATFTVGNIRTILLPPVRFGAFIAELYKIGVLSLFIICVCGLAVGMVLGLQGHHTLTRFGAQRSLGAVVGLSLIRELGPVLTALLVAGRAGSATTAEIGTMVATEQLDGLRMLSIDPVSLIIKPKAVAMLVSTPLLTALFIVCGIYGGYLVGVGQFGGDAGSYMSSLRSNVDFHNDIACSIVKSAIFGMLLGLISTYRGYQSAPTAEGVSAATTSSVVISSVAVLLTDYLITAAWGI
jgi:phospholipid/cholesterol/gamma-HCH transport system permease protein